MKNTLNKKYGYLLDNINGYPLDKFQRRIVFDDHDAVIVIAGAGTGKSTTIIGKIKYLINVLDYSSDEILCISFTNESVNSLQKGLLKNGINNINVQTFHKLALDIIGNQYNIIESDYLEYIYDELFYTSNDEKKLVLTIINLFKAQDLKYDIFYKIPKHYRNTVIVILRLLKIYEEEKHAMGAIDFDDMIKLASLSKEKLKYKYIIIDEYQDSSILKVNLIKNIIKNNGAKFLVVGDDYQSIYAFSGTDINIFLNFRKYFKKIKTFKLKYTYRNSQELTNVAGGFIKMNPYQIRKNLISNIHNKKPLYVCYYGNKIIMFKRIIDKIPANKSILVVGRNSFNINSYLDHEMDYDGKTIIYNNRNITYLTIHKSKGLEADYVIVLDCNNETYGIPSLIKEEKLVKYFKTNRHYYKYDEERRIFYVAITRSKNNVYLLVNKKKPSIFIKEIIKGYYKYINFIY